MLIVRHWLRHAEPVASEKAMRLFLECRRKMNVKTWLVLAESPEVYGPFLVGTIRPTLLLPKGFCTENDPQKLKVVLLHELAHLRRWDTWTSWGRSLLLTLYWFNPLLWLAVRRMNDDKEEACDVLALQTFLPQERPQYGHTLLKIANLCLTPHRAPGLVGISDRIVSEGGKLLTRRLDMINQLGTWKLRYKILAAILVLPLLIAVSTVAQDSRTTDEIRAEIQRLTEELRQIEDAEIPALVKQTYSPLGDGKSDDLPSDFPLLQFLGRYEGTEGKNRIEFNLELTIAGPEDPEFDQLDSSIREGSDGIAYKISRDLHIFINPKMEGLLVPPTIMPEINIQGRYSGRLKYINENELKLEVRYRWENDEEQDVPEVLKKLPVKVIRNGDAIMLEIPKNEIWDEIKVNRVIEVLSVPPFRDVPSEPEKKVFNYAVVRMAPEDRVKTVEVDGETRQIPYRIMRPVVESRQTPVNSLSFFNNSGDKKPKHVLFSDLDGPMFKVQVFTAVDQYYEGTGREIAYTDGALGSCYEFELRKAGQEAAVVKVKGMLGLAYNQDGNDERLTERLTLKLESDNADWNDTVLTYHY